MYHRSAKITPAEYESFKAFLQQACGILLGNGKEYLVSSRLNKIMQDAQVESLGALLKMLQSAAHTSLKVKVIDAMTTNETFWFRDIGHYILLKETILPDLNLQRGSSIRIWSAACSSGQEPYNISMIAEEYKLVKAAARPVQIIATDISSKMLEEARAGIYCGLSVERGLTQEQRRKFFVPKERCLEVKQEIKRRVRTNFKK